MVTATDPYVRDGDPATYSDTITVTITVTNVDEDPKIATGPASARVAEATTAAMNPNTYDPATPTYAATDDEDTEDTTDDVVLTLSGTDAAAFRLIAEGVAHLQGDRPTSRPRRMRARTTYTT